MNNGHPKFILAVILTVSCLLLTGSSIPKDIDARRRQVAQMTPTEKAQLYRLWERFKALPKEERENIKKLERQISEDETADELRDVMRRYYHWCRTLPAYQRLELQDYPIEERIAQIRNLKRQTENVAGLKKWLDAKAKQIEEQLSDEQRKRFSRFGPDYIRRMLFWQMRSIAKNSGRNTNNPLTDQDLANLRANLSEPTQRALEKLPPRQQWKKIVERLEPYLREQARRRRFDRHTLTSPYGIPNEDLATIFESLPLKRQDELLSLPAEDMLQQLQQIHMDRSLRKFRPRNPDNRPHRHPGSPRHQHPPPADRRP
jgi:hypothetical protein